MVIKKLIMRLCPADIGTTNSIRNIKNCIYRFIKCYGVVIMKNGMMNSSSTLFFLLRSFSKCTHLLWVIKSDKVHYLEYAIDLAKELQDLCANMFIIVQKYCQVFAFCCSVDINLNKVLQCTINDKCICEI